jgi:hypothetical protein
MVLRAMFLIAKAQQKRDYKKISKWLKFTLLMGLLSVLLSQP